MLTVELCKALKHSNMFGEIYWPGVGYIGVNSEDSVIGSIQYATSDRLQSLLHTDPKFLVSAMDHIEGLAYNMFPGKRTKWLWTIHANIADIFQADN